MTFNSTLQVCRSAYG